MTVLLAAAIAATAILALSSPRASGARAAGALIVAVAAAAHGYGTDLLLGAVAAATVTAGTVAFLYCQVVVILPADSWAAHAVGAS